MQRAKSAILPASTPMSMWARRMGAYHLINEIGGGDCWHPAEHAEAFRKHPKTGRAVCQICHPFPKGVE